MEAGGDEEFADGQNIQSSNADVYPSEPRDERSNGTCASYVLLTSCIFFVCFCFSVCGYLVVVHLILACVSREHGCG